MQGRYRNPNDGFGSGYRNQNRANRGGGGGGGGGGRGGAGGGGGGFSIKPHLPPPPPRKEEILMEAGRLAAEYLVFKGLLPPNSIPQKWPNSKYQEPATDGRTSALDRLSLNPDASRGRKRYGDDYDRNQFRGRKRTGSYGREYGSSSDWGRDGGRWNGRNRGYPNGVEGEDDYAPAAYQRDRRSWYDNLPSRSELTGESGSNHDVAEDTGSKASSSTTRKDPPTESDADLSKVGDGVGMASLETGDEVKSDASGDLKKRDVSEEDSGVQQTCAVEGDGKCDSDLLKMCVFSKVPTRPRSSVSQKSPKSDREVATEASNTVEVTSDVLEVAAEENPKDGSSSDSLANQTDVSKPHDISSIFPLQHLEESVIPGQETIQIPVATEEETIQREGVKRQREPSPEDEYSSQDNLGAKQSSPEEERLPMDDLRVEQLSLEGEKLSMDEEMVAPVAVDQEKPVENTCFAEVQPELDVKLEEEKEMLPTSFKICDLNLMGTPEITEIPDDPVIDHLHPPAPSVETGKELSMDFGLSIHTRNNGTEGYSQLPDDDRVVQVIDLDDDSPEEANACDPSKPKDEPMIYPNLDNFLGHEENADLPGIQDGYSLALSELLGTDISRCPSVPSDLSNLQGGMGLHDAEGVPNDDDSIYVSLGEIPIGFMEVWDQPPQDYGKFF
ncbi:uncharacterized protein M6B38_273560 [Iris pallida]|uniref:Uncharacterized protein n=1 Tax=Iris pallida TaxID=29817 RepID=A0AAX6I5Z9_IRIPA|nr:uncharacterized protein M6B38_273560 [Iris pallida]